MEEKEIAEMRREVKIALMKAGLRCDLMGFNYLCCAVELVLQDPDLINCLCKELYVKISKRFNVRNESCIERSIRHAIDQAARANSFAGLNQMFGAELYANGEKPTSGELIRLIVEYYQLGLYKDVA